METFNIYEAKTQLSRLLKRVRAGEEIVIADVGTPIARIVPFSPPPPARTLGASAGKIWIADDFDAPMLDIEAAFSEGEIAPASGKAKTAGSRKPKAPSRKAKTSRRTKR